MALIRFASQHREKKRGNKSFRFPPPMLAVLGAGLLALGLLGVVIVLALERWAPQVLHKLDLAR